MLTEALFKDIDLVENTYTLIGQDSNSMLYGLIGFSVALLIALCILAGMFMKNPDNRLRQIFSSTPLFIAYLLALTGAWVAIIIGVNTDTDKLNGDNHKIFDQIEKDYNITIPDEQRENIARRMYENRQGIEQTSFNYTSETDKGVRTIWFVTEPGRTDFTVVSIKPASE